MNVYKVLTKTSICFFLISVKSYTFGRRELSFNDASEDLIKLMMPRDAEQDFR